MSWAVPSDCRLQNCPSCQSAAFLQLNGWRSAGCQVFSGWVAQDCCLHHRRPPASAAWLHCFCLPGPGQSQCLFHQAQLKGQSSSLSLVCVRWTYDLRELSFITLCNKNIYKKKKFCTTTHTGQVNLLVSQYMSNISQHAVPMVKIKMSHNFL